MSIEKFSLNPSIAIVIAGVVIAAAIVYVNGHPAPAPADTGALPASADVPAPRAGDHIIGSPTAPIVLIEYADFQCPYCSLVHSTLKRIVAESNGGVAWVMRNFPLESIHPEAKPAATAAECIAGLLGNDAYWKYVDAVFANQAGLNAAYSRLLAIGFGANATQYDQCVAADTYKERIAADAGDAITNGGTGTPYTVVWSKKYQAPISGALPYAQFVSVISAVKARQ